MKILVTGGAGFIGSHVVDAYIAMDHRVVVVDDLSTGRKSNLNSKATFYQLDFADPDIRHVLEIEKPDIINHHAAQVDVRRSVADPIFDAEINILKSIKLAQLALECGIKKIIYISSGGAVYGEPEYLPCDENHPIKPLAPYGASKYTFELYLYLFKENYGLDYTVLRYGNVYGPRQDPNGEAGVVAIFTGKMLNHKPVTINGSGEQERDFIFVAECAQANLLALEKGSGRVYNLASGVGTSINNIFSSLKDIIGNRQEANYGPEKTGETFRIFLNARRAEKDLGWNPTVGLDQGLRQTVAYFNQVGLDDGSV